MISSQVTSATAVPTSPSPGVVLAGVGDHLLEAGLASEPGSLGYRSDRLAGWLRMLLPDVVTSETSMLGEAGVTAPQMLERLNAFLPTASRTGIVLLSAGLEDCRATMRGVAPSSEASIAAIEAAAVITVAAGSTPVFVLPPPSPLFANGLFAERYVTLAATLRRLARHDPRIGVVDPTSRMTRARAFGIEPEPGLVREAGELTPAGAYRLAVAVTGGLRTIAPAASALTPPDGKPLNHNPWLDGGIASPVLEAGCTCAAGYAIDTQSLASLRVSGCALEGGGQRLGLSGRLVHPSGFIRLSHALDPERLSLLAAGDGLEASAEIVLRGVVGPVSAVRVHATPVWDGGFIGLHSHDHAGRSGFDGALQARLCTPRFRVPARLKRLHVSLTAHLHGFAGAPIDAELDIRSLAVTAISQLPDQLRTNPLRNAA